MSERVWDPSWEAGSQHWALLERLLDATVSCMGQSSCNSAERGSWLQGHPQVTLPRSQTPSGHELLSFSTVQPESAYFAELPGLLSPAPFAPDPAPLCTISDAPTGTNVEVQDAH